MRVWSAFSLVPFTSLPKQRVGPLVHLHLRAEEHTLLVLPYFLCLISTLETCGRVTSLASTIEQLRRRCSIWHNGRFGARNEMTKGSVDIPNTPPQYTVTVSGGSRGSLLVLLPVEQLACHEYDCKFQISGFGRKLQVAEMTKTSRGKPKKTRSLVSSHNDLVKHYCPSWVSLSTYGNAPASLAGIQHHFVSSVSKMIEKCTKRRREEP